MTEWNDKRRHKLIQSLFTAPVRRCQTLHHCILCGKPIELGEQYADRGYPRRAHHSCVQYAAAIEDIG